MVKMASVLLLVLCLAACATYRQPRVKCSGHLERINVSVPEEATPPTADAPEEEGAKR